MTTKIPCGVSKWLLVAGHCGCSVGGQTGEEFLSDNEQNSTPPISCEEHGRNVDSIAAVVPELGFSASDVVAFAAGESTVAWRWLEVDRIEYTPGVGSSMLTIRVEVDEDDVRFVTSRPRSEGPILDAGEDHCPDFVSLGVEIQMSTADGGLEERFGTRLRAETLELAEAEVSVEPGGFEGTFSVLGVEAEEGEGEVVRMALSLTFSENGAAGDLSGSLLVEGDEDFDGEALYPLRFAEWGQEL